MNDQQKIEILKKCFEDTIWMAIRYADGRSTYAPSVVRDSIKKFQLVYPDWQPQADLTITPPKGTIGAQLHSDYLFDLFQP